MPPQGSNPGDATGNEWTRAAVLVFMAGDSTVVNMSTAVLKFMSHN